MTRGRSDLEAPTKIYNCYSNPGTSDYWDGDNTGGIVAATRDSDLDYVHVYNCYYVHGDTERDKFGNGDTAADAPPNRDNNWRSSIWYEGHANGTINSDANLSNIGRDSDDLMWYDSFGNDADLKETYGGYIRTTSYRAREDNYQERNGNLKIILIDYAGDTIAIRKTKASGDLGYETNVFWITGDYDVKWTLEDDTNLNIHQYALIDIPTIKISKKDTAGDPLNIKDVHFNYLKPGGDASKDDDKIDGINRSSTYTINTDDDF